MHKLYNPDDGEFLLNMDGVEVKLAPRSFGFFEMKDITLKKFKESAPAIEVVESTSAEAKAFTKAQEPEKPKTKKKGAKHGKKKK